MRTHGLYRNIHACATLRLHGLPANFQLIIGGWDIVDGVLRSELKPMLFLVGLLVCAQWQARNVLNLVGDGLHSGLDYYGVRVMNGSLDKLFGDCFPCVDAMVVSFPPIGLVVWILFLLHLDSAWLSSEFRIRHFSNACK